VRSTTQSGNARSGARLGRASVFVAMADKCSESELAPTCTSGRALRLSPVDGMRVVAGALPSRLLLAIMTHPHTLGGRLPTDREWYRYYANRLLG